MDIFLDCFVITERLGIFSVIENHIKEIYLIKLLGHLYFFSYNNTWNYHTKR